MKSTDASPRRRRFDTGMVLLWLILVIAVAGCATAEQMEASRVQLDWPSASPAPR